MQTLDLFKVVQLRLQGTVTEIVSSLSFKDESPSVVVDAGVNGAAVVVVAAAAAAVAAALGGLWTTPEEE